MSLFYLMISSIKFIDVFRCLKRSWEIDQSSPLRMYLFNTITSFLFNQIVRRGRILGGSSAINYLVMMRASSPEYDAWSQFGKGWDWNGLLPYFKKKEQYTAPKWGTEQIFPGVSKADDNLARQKQDQFYGKNGPIHSNNNDMYSGLEQPSITTLNNLKIKTNRLQARDYLSFSDLFRLIETFFLGIRRFYRHV